MVKVSLRFLFGLLILLTVLVPLNYFLLQAVLKIEFKTINYGVLAYFALLISAVQFSMQNSLKKRPQRFVLNFMAAMGIKMFLSLIFLLILLYFFEVDKKVFGINYLVLYFIFSAYSITNILLAQKVETKDE